MADTGEDLDRAALRRNLVGLGVVAVRLDPIAGDASLRRFFRANLAGGGSVVAAAYPNGAAAQVAHDVAAQRWGRERGLPIPALVAAGELLIVSEDVGADSLTALVSDETERALELALETLARFQRVDSDGGPNPPFDAAFFRRELAGFEELVLPGTSRTVAVGGFLDSLARNVAAHPYRLVHRDFHADNLLLHQGAVWAVDFQDMRAGPDTYDAVSLLCERAVADRGVDPGPWLRRAAMLCAWRPGWPQRVIECRAQRGLKVLGTFRRLARAGRRDYHRFEGAVVRGAAQALSQLDAPRELLAALTGAVGGAAV